MNTITLVNPHCTGWAVVKASIWGMRWQHELDEPVPITHEQVMRVRRLANGKTVLKTGHIFPVRVAAIGTMLRLRYKNGAWEEFEIVGVKNVPSNCCFVEVDELE